jgi:hypothetical protein
VELLELRLPLLRWAGQTQVARASQPLLPLEQKPQRQETQLLVTVEHRVRVEQVVLARPVEQMPVEFHELAEQ